VAATHRGVISSTDIHNFCFQCVCDFENLETNIVTREPTMPHPVTPRPAATVILVRDGEFGLEVLMVRRNKKLEVAADALVFPGGAMEKEDQGFISTPEGEDNHEGNVHSMALRVAAVRETFEEAGILLVRRSGDQRLIGAEQAGALLARYRQAHPEGVNSFHDMIRREGLELAIDLLVPTVRWITPEIRPRRYDTHFFICPSPSGQIARHDGSETVNAFWITPEAALEGADDGRYLILLPTRRSLVSLRAAHNVAGAIDAARSKPVTTTMSTVRFVADGEFITVPEDVSNAAEEYFVAKPSI
jgi:8-oxo-dGTP pyrophosphatase MutT (NUDIX family)